MIDRQFDIVNINNNNDNVTNNNSSEGPGGGEAPPSEQVGSECCPVSYIEHWKKFT